MNLWVNALLITLLLQGVLVATVYWPPRNLAESASELTLLPFDDSAIDEIRISDEFDNEAVLVKVDDLWLLPDTGNLPADPAKIEQLLQAVSGHNDSWPIAHSESARQRFQVVEYYHQRKLSFLGNAEMLGTVYLGTSPGFRKVHARNETQDAIVAITFNTFDAPPVAGLWVEPRLMQIRSPLQIDADSYSLLFENGHWRSGTRGIPDERELEVLINALRTIQIDGLAPQDAQRSLSAAEADLVMDVRALAGKVTLALFTLNNEHFIHSSDYPQFFKLSAYDFDRLTGIDFRLISGELSQ